MPKTVAFSIEMVLCRRFFLWIPNVTTKPVHFPLRTECAVYEISGHHLANFWKAGSIVFFLCVLLHWWIGHQQMGSGKTSLERTFGDFTTSRFTYAWQPATGQHGREGEGGKGWVGVCGGRSILTWHYLWWLGPLQPASGMTISTFLAYWCPQGRSNSCSTSGRPVWLGHSLNTNMRDHPNGFLGML